MFEIKHPHHRHLSREQAIAAHRSGQSGRTYYYVVATVRGDKMIWGAYNSYSEAERQATSKTNGYYEIIKRTTSDVSEVSQEFREQDIETNGLTPDSFKRFGHR